MRTAAGNVKDITLDDCNWYVRGDRYRIHVQLKDEYWTEAWGVLSDYQADQIKDLPVRTRKSLEEICDEWSPVEPLGDAFEAMMKSFE